MCTGQNGPQAAQNTDERNFEMKRTVTAMICTLILALALAACGAGGGGNAAQGDADNVRIPAPWTDFANAEEAAAEVGFGINAPARVGDCEFDFARAFDGGMLELVYTGRDGSSVSIRKAEGNGDISGDYNEYAESGTLDAGGTAVAVKGDGEGVSLALWSANGYAYAISARGAALAESEVAALVSAVTKAG